MIIKALKKQIIGDRFTIRLYNETRIFGNSTKYKDSEGKTIDYVRMAYALALSIKHTQKSLLGMFYA